MEALRIDLVFSYWVFIWYLLFIYKVVNYSPKFVLILGLIENIGLLLLMIWFRTSIKTIILFITINTIIKVIPLYSLRNNIIKMKDIYFTFCIFIVYIIWLHINNQSLSGNLKLIYDSLIHNKHNTPFFHLFYKFEQNFKRAYT